MVRRRSLALTLWAWLGACALICVSSAAAGAERGAIATFGAITFMPAATGFILLSRFTEAWARIYFFCVWALAAAMLAMMTGGATSPMVAMFVLAPAYAMAMGGEDFWWAAGVSVLGYAGAAVLGGAAVGLAMAPAATACAAVALAAVVMLMGRERPQAQRLAELAHELRTPLNHMVGFAELIEKQALGPIDQRYAEYGGLIATSGRQMAEMVSRRLDFARTEAGAYALHPEQFDARDAAAEAVKLAHATAAQKRIALTALLPEAAMTLRADRVAVRQILTNLVGNALKFTPEGGRVQVGVAREGANVVFEVEDTGPGIAAEDRVRMMRPYERGAGGAEGSGLGLALVQTLAELHGGDVKLEASKMGNGANGGTLARVRLPADG